MKPKKAVKKSLTKKGQPKEMGFSITRDEFIAIISGKKKTIKRDIASYGANTFWKEWVDRNKQIPGHFTIKYAPGTLLFMMESFRPEKKPNGDIHRYWDDKDSFVPAPSEKYRKIRWYSNFNMRKKDSRLYLRIVKFSMDKEMKNWLWKVEIDKERSKPEYWPKVESNSKKINKVKIKKK
jgi:hypothetical protein